MMYWQEQFNLIICPQDNLKMSWRHVWKTFWKRLQSILKTSWRYLDVFSRRLEDSKKSWRQIIKMNIFMLMFMQHVLKTSWKRLEDKSPRWIYSFWSKHLEDVFWRHMTESNIFVLIKRSRRRRRKTSSRSLQNFLIKMNVC